MNLGLSSIDEYRRQKAKAEPSLSFHACGQYTLQVALRGQLPNGMEWQETLLLSRSRWFFEYRLRRAKAKLLKRYKTLCDAMKRDTP